MLKRLSTKGFSPIAIVIVLAVVATVSLGGWYVWQNRDKKQSNNNTSGNTSTANVEPEDSETTMDSVDPTEGGKYLVIEEWGARVELPSNMKGKVAYSLSESETDPGGNIIQGLDILTATNALSSDNFCATQDSLLGPVIDSGAQYIRSERAKPFDAARYRWTFKENILTDNQYNYHLNYVTPDCVGSTENAMKIEGLQMSLVHLDKK